MISVMCRAAQIVHEHNSYEPLVTVLRRIRSYDWKLDDSADAFDIRLRTNEVLALANKATGGEGE